MCGIAGVALSDPAGAPPGSLKRLAAGMAEQLVHRGPDDCGLWESPDARVALAHRRLSIIDLSPLGRNPMVWGGDRLWVTFNGEIYNYLELRRELEAAGHRFRSQTDTEVILAAYDAWGLECVHRFVGMFAFALWDSPRRRLWLVRDRLGKKPLYYAHLKGALRFASELKGIVADRDVPREVDAEALRAYLLYGNVPAPLTIYRHVRKLPPGHHLVFEEQQATVTRYWDPVPFALNRHNRSDEEATAELDEVLKAAVRGRMIADVPLGAFLSGGIDSSLIVALMQEQSSAPVRTFTVRFANREYNEADHAAAVARHLGTEHHERSCGEREMLDLVDRLPDVLDEPFADSSVVPTLLVSSMARQLVTVALSGDGGDELFLGYPRYAYHARSAAILGLPRPIRRAAALFADQLPTRRLRRIADVLRSDAADQYVRFISWWTPADVAQLTGERPEAAPFYADALGRASALTRMELAGLLDIVSYLPDDILTKVDRASMAVSLETRCPLLDHRVVEFALSLPPSMKHRGGTGKWLLRQALYKRVPRKLIDRPKMGFGVPLADWFRGPLRDRMESYCAGSELADLGVDPIPVRTLWQDFARGRSHRTDLLWQMFVLASWAQRFRSLPLTLSA